MQTSQYVQIVNSPSFIRNTEFESCVLMHHEECSLCGKVEPEPHAIVAVSVTTKDPRTDHRLYFPFYHLLCRDCHEALCLENAGIDILKNYQPPSWSLISDYLAFADIRPSGIAEFNDQDAVMNLVERINEVTDSWEAFDEISFGEYRHLVSDENFQ